MKNPNRAPQLHLYVVRAAALIILTSGLAFAGPLSAAPLDLSAPQDNVTDQDASPPPAKSSHWHDGKKERSPEAMARHVETRIKTLHDKLGVTGPQEAKWGVVAQTMRDNEANISQLIETRHQSVQTMTAIDDLQSYENITQAHADGIKKLITVFQDLYSDMSDDQKKIADETFGSFEGHGGHKSFKKHK